MGHAGPGRQGAGGRVRVYQGNRGGGEMEDMLQIHVKKCHFIKKSLNVSLMGGANFLCVCVCVCVLRVSSRSAWSFLTQRRTPTATSCECER